MSLIIATGSNLGDRLQNLNIATGKLSEKFKFIAQSDVFESPAIEYSQQPDFLNQVLEFEIPDDSPHETMQYLLRQELDMGRNRSIPKGPRIIDLDILFWKTDKINIPDLIVPHPRWSERSFVVYPLQQLPYFHTLQKHFIIPSEFNNTAVVYQR